MNNTLMFETLETIIAVVNSAMTPKEDTYSRLKLRTVQLDPKEENVIVVTATNGHQLTQISVEDEGLNHALNNKAILIVADDIKNLKVFLKTNKHESEFTFTLTPNHLLISTDHGLTCLLNIKDDNYPNVDKMIHDVEPTEFKIEFDPNELIKINKAHIALIGTKHPNPYLIFEFTDANSKIMITSPHDSNFKAVLMPCRI